MYPIKNGNTTRDLVFLLISSTDHITGLTGAAPTVTIRKNGGSFTSPAGAVSEIADGWYRVAPNATDANTPGPLALHASASGADPCDELYQVVNFDPDDAAALGLSRLDAAVSGRMATFTLPANFSAMAISSGGDVTVGGFANGAITTAAFAAGAVNATVAPNLDAAVSSRMAAFTLPANFALLAIDGAGNLSLVPAQNPLTRTGIARGGSTTTLTLDSGASSVDSFYLGQTLRILSGTGAGQSRIITQYVGASGVATVGRAFQTAPDATSVYAIMGTDAPRTDQSLRIDLGLWVGSAPTALISGLVQADIESWFGTPVGPISALATSATQAAIQAQTDKLAFDAQSYVKSDPQTAVTVAANQDKTGYSLAVAPPTSAQIATAVFADLMSGSDFAVSGSFGALVKSNLDTNVGSRLAAATYVAPDNTDIAAIAALTAKVNTMLAASGANWTYTPDALKNAPSSGGGAAPNLTAEIVEVRAR